QGDYTAVNTGAIAYLWTESGYTQGEVPETEVSNGLLVEVYDDEVVIKRRNFTGERCIGEPCVINTADASNGEFTYTDDRDQENPYFEDNAFISIKHDKTTTSSVNVNFTQAKDNLLTHSYKITATNQDTGDIDKIGRASCRERRQKWAGSGAV